MASLYGSDVLFLWVSHMELCIKPLSSGSRASISHLYSECSLEILSNRGYLWTARHSSKDKKRLSVYLHLPLLEHPVDMYMWNYQKTKSARMCISKDSLSNISLANIAHGIIGLTCCDSMRTWSSHSLSSI